MFEDSLIESSNVLKTQRPAATAVSLLAQSLLVAMMASLPLLYTEALPRGWAVSLVAPGPPPPAPAPVRAEAEHRTKARASDMVGQKLREPRAIPKHVAKIEEGEPPFSAAPSEGPGVPRGTGDPAAGNALNAIISLAPPPVAPKPSAAGPLRVSQGVAQGFLVHAVKPVYPPLARQARIQGTVMLQAVIGKDGRIENLQVMSGHPMLSPAAMDAVRQWRYRPYTLNGEPVEVETEITVNFVLGGG